jgi:hypothetical protein
MQNKQKGNMSISQFQKDSEIITKFVVISAGLSNNTELIKNAGMVDTLKNIGQGIVEDVKTRFEKEGWAALVTYFVYGKLGILSPIYWVLQGVEHFFGISPGSVLKSAIDMARGVTESTGTFTEQDADDIANKVTSGITSTASLNYLYLLEKNGEIVNSLKKEAGIFQRLINNLNPNMKKGLIGGMFRWLIKAILLGVSAAWATVKGVGKAEIPGAVVSESPSISGSMRISNLPPTKSHNLVSSGKGNQYHVNEGNTIWIVPLVNSDVKETLLRWVVEVYPELKEKIDELKGSSSINRMVSLLESNYNPQYPGYLQIVPGLHSWKDIVDRSIGDVV